MAIADMYLKIAGVTGESVDAAHAGEIEVTGWSWGITANASYLVDPASGSASEMSGRSLKSLTIIKRVDRSSPTLLHYLNTRKVIKQATLTVRKAGGATPLDYVTIELKDVRLLTIDFGSQHTELIESIAIGFETINFTYTPQGNLGGKGGGDISFSATHAPVR
jgi:type VI secretion system secreted protein Hcp